MKFAYQTELVGKSLRVRPQISWRKLQGVKTGKAQREQMISALPSTSAISRRDPFGSFVPYADKRVASHFRADTLEERCAVLSTKCPAEAPNVKWERSS
jgi:hypothetical protein